MPRLPLIGSDDNTWGTILNDYLSVSHNSDGSLKAGAVAGTVITDGTIPESKLDAGVQAKLNGAGGVTNLTATATTTDLTIVSSSGTDATVSSATGSVAGVLTASDKTKLDGIAAGAQVNTVSSVAGKTGVVTLTKTDVGLGSVDDTSDAAKSFAASQVASGTLDIARIPTGTSGSTVSLGNHTHTGYLPTKNGNPALTDSTNDRFARIDISDDASPTAGWPDRMAFYFNGTRSGYFNEYGELRARPGKVNTVALRAMKWASSSTVDIFQVTSSDGTTIYLGVGPSTIAVNAAINSTQDINTTGAVSGSNIGNKVTASATAPASPAVGDVWVDLSA